MNSKKIMKIGVALMVIATILMAFNMVFANVTIPQPNAPKSTELKSATQNILGIVSYICYAAAVVMLVVLGVRFMAASPEGKAEIKKSSIQYVVGAVLVFAAGAILSVINGLGIFS